MKGIGGLLKQAKEIQKNMQQAQEDMHKITAEGEAGAGLVKVTINGLHDVIDLQIDDNILEEGTTLLQELIAGALNSANKKLEIIKKEKMKEMSGGISLPEGFKMPF